MIAWQHYYLPDCFRCHPHITEFPSRQYYRGTVTSFGTPSRSPGHDLFPPASFIDVSPADPSFPLRRSSISQTQVLEALLMVLYHIEGPQILILVYYAEQYVNLASHRSSYNGHILF